MLTFVFLFITVEFPSSQDKLPIIGLVLGFHPATHPGICTNRFRVSCPAITKTRLTKLC